MQLATKYIVYIRVKELLILLVTGGAFPLIFVTDVSPDKSQPCLSGDQPYSAPTADRWPPAQVAGPGGRGVRGDGSCGLEPPGGGGSPTPQPPREWPTAPVGPRPRGRTPPPLTHPGF